MKQAKPQTVLYLSDTHIGGNTSVFSRYQKSILQRMKQYDHVVLNGDIFELFHVDSGHIDELVGLLELLDPHRDWRSEFTAESNINSGELLHMHHPKLREFATQLNAINPAINLHTPLPVHTNTQREKAENVMLGAKLFLEEFMRQNPSVHIHLVGGNHENIRKFHSMCKKIQKDFPQQFEWSREAIRLGDALITHGHFPLDGKTRKEYGEVRLRSIEDVHTWRDLITNGAIKGMYSPLIEMGAGAEYRLKKHTARPEKIVGRLADNLYRWSGTDQFYVSEGGVRAPLTMKGIKHVFFGHTHVKFDNYIVDGSFCAGVGDARHPDELAATVRAFGEGLTFHNTGAVVYATAQKPEGLGILESELVKGEIINVRPVAIEMQTDSTTSRRWARQAYTPPARTNHGR